MAKNKQQKQARGGAQDSPGPEEAPGSPQARLEGVHPRLPPTQEVHAVPELVVSLPWVHGPGYCGRIVEIMLTPRQAQALKAVRDGLSSSGATRRWGNGREMPVRNGLDAVRLILERVADKLKLGPNGEVPADAVDH